MTSFELIPRIGVELTTRHIPGVVDPLSAPSAWYVLCRAVFLARRTNRSKPMLQNALDSALGIRLDHRRRRGAERARARSVLAAARIHSRGAAQGRREPQARHLGAGFAGAALHRSRGRLGGAAHSAGRARVPTAISATATCTSTSTSAPARRSFQLQAVEPKAEARDPRFRAGVRRQLLRRTRHRPAEGLRARALRESGGARSHAPREAGVRSRTAS